MWQAVGGKRPCDGCGQRVDLADLAIVATLDGRVYCKDPACFRAWSERMNERMGRT